MGRVGLVGSLLATDNNNSPYLTYIIFDKGYLFFELFYFNLTRLQQEK